MRKPRLRKAKHLAVGLGVVSGDLEPELRTVAGPSSNLLALVWFAVPGGCEKLDSSSWCQYREWEEMLDRDQS